MQSSVGKLHITWFGLIPCYSYQKKTYYAVFDTQMITKMYHQLNECSEFQMIINYHYRL